MAKFSTLLALALVATLAASAPASIGTEGVAIGSAAPVFQEATLDGARVGLADYSGRTILLWFTNFSSGCNASFPTLRGVATRHPGAQILVIGTTGTDIEPPRHFEQHYALGRALLVDEDGSTVLLYTGSYEPGACPLHNLIVIDPRGRVAATHHFPGTPPRTLEEELGKL